MFELLSCKRLFEGDTERDILRKVSACEVLPLELFRPEAAKEVRRILCKALERDPDKRYQDAGEMGYDLEHFMYHDRFGPTNITLQRYLKTVFWEEEADRFVWGLEPKGRERTRIDRKGEKLTWSEGAEGQK